MYVPFIITIRSETFITGVQVDLTTNQVAGTLIQQVSSVNGQRKAVFVFRRQLGRTDSAISMHIKLLNARGETEQVWHAVVDRQGTLLHLHMQ